MTKGFGTASRLCNRLTWSGQIACKIDVDWVLVSTWNLEGLSNRGSRFKITDKLTSERVFQGHAGSQSEWNFKKRTSKTIHDQRERNLVQGLRSQLAIVCVCIFTEANGAARTRIGVSGEQARRTQIHSSQFQFPNKIKYTREPYELDYNNYRENWIYCRAAGRAW